MLIVGRRSQILAHHALNEETMKKTFTIFALISIISIVVGLTIEAEAAEKTRHYLYFNTASGMCETAHIPVPQPAPEISVEIPERWVITPQDCSTGVFMIGLLERFISEDEGEGSWHPERHTVCAVPDGEEITDWCRCTGHCLIIGE